MITIPWDDAFEGKDYKPAPELEELAATLVEMYSELSFIAEFRLRVLWKREAPAAGSKEVAGRCKALSGELAYFARADWLIWIAADFAAVNSWGPREIEAVLYHELRHCAIRGKDEIRPAVRQHDLETFFSEVERYGTWTLDLRRAKAVFMKPLPGFEDVRVRDGGGERGLAAAAPGAHAAPVPSGDGSSTGDESSADLDAGAAHAAGGAS